MLYLYYCDLKILLSVLPDTCHHYLFYREEIRILETNLPEPRITQGFESSWSRFKTS